MEINEILGKVDHTVLSQTTTLEQIYQVCDDAIKYKTASVCIPACYVKDAKKYVKNKTKICTVIGFPNGNQTTDTKCFEAKEAVDNGADEIDMVINIGYLKDKRYADILNEINLIKAECQNKILKVIVEACLLTEDEKIKMCEIVSQSQADYIKTSTGFSTGGATKNDIALFKKNITNGKKIKAAGSISSLQDASEFISLGADRLGTSKIVKIVKNEQSNTY